MLQPWIILVNKVLICGLVYYLGGLDILLGDGVYD